jgi:polysaccharide lyase-like protein
MPDRRLPASSLAWLGPIFAAALASVALAGSSCAGAALGGAAGTAAGGAGNQAGAGGAESEGPSAAGAAGAAGAVEAEGGGTSTAGAGGAESEGPSSGGAVEAESGGTSAAGAANAGSAGTGGASTGTGCGALALCDTFEDTMVGERPNSSLWTQDPPGPSGPRVDSIGAHGSSHSLRVSSLEGQTVQLRNTSVIGTLGPVVHLRFYLRLAETLPDRRATLIVTHSALLEPSSNSGALRFGGWGSVYHWSTQDLRSPSPTLPDLSPNGNAASVAPAVDTWYCIELTLNTNGSLNAAIDGVDVPGLTADDTPTPDIDQAWLENVEGTGGTGNTILTEGSRSHYKSFADFSFGWDGAYSGWDSLLHQHTLWYDDIALSSEPIGCL